MYVNSAVLFVHEHAPQVTLSVTESFKTVTISHDGCKFELSADTLEQLADVAHKILAQIQDIQSPRADQPTGNPVPVEIGGEL